MENPQKLIPLPGYNSDEIPLTAISSSSHIEVNLRWQVFSKQATTAQPQQKK